MNLKDFLKDRTLTRKQPREVSHTGLLHRSPVLCAQMLRTITIPGKIIFLVLLMQRFRIRLRKADQSLVNISIMPFILKLDANVYE